MNILKELYEALPSLVITLAVITVVVLALWAANWFLLRRNRNLGEEAGVSRRIVMGVLVLLGCMIILLAVPIDDDTRSQLIGLLGLLLSVVIALASTTFVANAMAGFMLRAVRSFRSGDFIQVGEQFGRVTERGTVSHRNPDRRPRPNNTAEPVLGFQPGQGDPILGNRCVGYRFVGIRRTTQASGVAC